MSNNSNVLPPQPTGANSEKKPEEESGGILEGLFGKSESDKKDQEGNDKAGSEENKGGIMNMFSSDTTKENANTGATGEKTPEEPGILSKITKGLGIGTDENKDAAASAATTTEPVNEVEEQPNDVGLAASQPNLPVVNENDAKKKEEGDASFIDKVTGIFKPAAGEEEKAKVTGESSDETEEESDEEDEDESTDDDEVDVFVTKIKTLREKCKKMREKHRKLKDKYKDLKSSGSKNKDISEWTTAMDSLKKFAEKNKLPMDGMFEKERESETESESEGETERKSNEAPNFGSNNMKEEMDIESSGSASSASASSASEDESENENELLNNASSSQISVQSDFTDNASTVKPSSNESLPVMTPPPSTVSLNEPLRMEPANAPTISPPGSTTVNESEPMNPNAKPNSFLGGKNHYVNKNHIKTHRHHKRRKRHQTLKNLF